MKTFLIFLLLCTGAFAKDPKPKAPHIYIACAVVKDPVTTKDGETIYTLVAVDQKGDKILVGVSEAVVQYLGQMGKQTAISFAK